MTNTPVSYYKFNGWQTMGEGNRGFRHTSGAAVVKNVMGMWVGVRVSKERDAFPYREQAMRWAICAPRVVNVPIKQKRAANAGWPNPDDKILATVREIGPATMATIVETLGLSPAGAHAPLFRLLGKGLVVRRAAEDDRAGRLGRRTYYLWEVAA